MPPAAGARGGGDARVRRIVVDWGGQTLLNLGDLAMLIVTVRRLARSLPGARIHVSAHPGAGLERHLPGAEVLDETVLQALFWRRAVPGMVSRVLPFVRRVEDALFRRDPFRVLAVRGWRTARGAGGESAVRRTIDALREADLAVAAGGGYLTDAFPAYVIRIAGLLSSMLHAGRRVLMFGQGLGPLEDPVLREVCRPVLRAASGIALREGIAGPALLRAMGCDPGRFEVTGDDALEFVEWCREGRAASERENLGLNLRLAGYAGTDAAAAGTVGEVVQEFARDRRVEILPCPIDIDPEHGDGAAVRRLIRSGLSMLPDPGDPRALADRIAGCRIMVTSSYHGAVFALAQGVPAVGLARSAYYRDKFAGLQDQFGGACLVVRLDGHGAAETLRARMSEAWERSEELGAAALAAAQAQLAVNRSVFEAMISRV